MPVVAGGVDVFGSGQRGSSARTCARLGTATGPAVKAGLFQLLGVTWCRTPGGVEG